MNKLNPSEKAKAAKSVMTAGAKAVVNGKLDKKILQEKLRELIRSNAPQADKRVDPR